MSFYEAVLLDACLSPPMKARILGIIDRDYVVYEKEKPYALLACLDCDECWSIRIPESHKQLAQVVDCNGHCITCGSVKIVLMEV